MKVPNPAPQLQPQPNAVAPRSPLPQRRLGAADLADLTQTPAVAPPQSAPAKPAQVETRPVRPGSLLDIRV